MQYDIFSSRIFEQRHTDVVQFYIKIIINKLKLDNMFLKLDALQELHAKWENSELEDLNKELDEYSNELSSLQEPINETLKEAISNFIKFVPMNSGFGVSSAVVAIYNKVTAHEPTEEQTVLSSIEYRILQKIVVESKPTNIQQMIAVDAILKATNHIAIRFGNLEQKSQLISNVIVKKEKENVTGLKFSEEDNANTRPNESNVPASLHVVKDADVDDKTNQKKEKKTKKSAATVKAEK